MIKRDISKVSNDICALLNSYYELPISDIGSFLKVDDEQVFIALGWLARDRKIFFFEEDENIMKVCLIE
ncbi:MAG: winged helix-turn-helix domain-containing protein [Bacteroidota bacterium]|nr:winged helix-turn-helix domain-containing protein [Bacteroidota bacterium]